MNSDKLIQPKLFTLLAEIKPLLIKISDGNELKPLQIRKVRDNIIAFIGNFFIQFFKEGYGYQIEGFNDSTIKEMKKYFLGKTTPIKMIDQVENYLINSKDIMGNPYTRETRELKMIYDSFLPSLYNTFKTNYQKVITNHDEIESRFRDFLK